MGGDFNFDPWRFEERRAAGLSQSVLTQHLEHLLSSVTADLVRFPANRLPTFSENGVLSTIDHWFVSSAILVSDCRPLRDFSRQHAPLSVSLNFQIPPTANLDSRGANLKITPDSLRLVRAQLMLLANDLNVSHWNVNQLYNQILGCFLVYGRHRDQMTTGPLSEQWTSFLSEDEKEVLRDLDRSNQRLADLILSNAASDLDITAFRRHRAQALSDLKKKAEKELQRLL
jgi:hypothetical protein